MIVRLNQCELDDRNFATRLSKLMSIVVGTATVPELPLNVKLLKNS